MIAERVLMKAGVPLCQVAYWLLVQGELAL